MEFFQGTTLIATRTAAPYSILWTGVPAGGYSLTARATDNQGASTTSAPVNVTVNAAVAQLYFIHTDHLNTPRVITNQASQVVWRWDHAEPFGSNPPNENPSGLGTFTCNLRLPGQYFDKETNLHYNYFRDYDPGIGRYVQSDPIGLKGGLNTYAYVNARPLTSTDPHGLKSITEKAAGELAEKIGSATPAAAIGRACGIKLCVRGQTANSPGRYTLILQECEPATALMPYARSTDPFLECIDVCEKVVDRCQRIQSGALAGFCLPS